MFNVTLIQPAGYVHALAIDEAADYLVAMLEACGQSARRSSNHIELGGNNLVLCSHLLGEAHVAQLPANTILFNSEPLAHASPAYLQALARFHVWKAEATTRRHPGKSRQGPQDAREDPGSQHTPS